MNNQRIKLTQIRAKKLGLLLYDARIARNKSIEECALILNISPDQYNDYESGEKCPSLPEIELITHYFDIPITHFFGDITISQQISKKDGNYFSKLNQIRNSTIAVQLRLSRESLNLSLAEVAEKTSIPEEKLIDYESGIPVPVSELSLLADVYHINLEELVDQYGPIGVWLEEKKKFQKYQRLPSHIQEFVTTPVNQPYLELAIKLSKLPAGELRQVAENILQITL